MKDYINLHNKRDCNWIETKTENPLLAISAVSGAGKTTFLQSLPFFIEDCESDLLPLYITFIDNCPILDEENKANPHRILCMRILYNFIRSTCNVKMPPYISFYEENNKDLCDLKLSNLIKYLMFLTKKKGLLILVDETLRIPNKLRNKCITLLGQILDKFKHSNIIISTLDYMIFDKFRTGSNRAIEYLYLSPITRILDVVKNLKNKNGVPLTDVINLIDKNSSIVELTLLESSFIPRITNEIVQTLLDFELDESKINFLQIPNYLEFYFKEQENYNFKLWAIINFLLNFSNRYIKVSNYRSLSYNKVSIKLGECQKYGILMYISNRIIYLNLSVVESLIEDLDIPEWTPAYYFRIITKIKFNPQGKFAYKYFEIFNAYLDIMYRMFIYYDKNIFPSTQSKSIKKISYSDLFPSSIIMGEGNEKFELKNQYYLNEDYAEFKKTHDKESTFDFLTDDDWVKFFNGSNVFLNIENGIGFDSVVFDSPNFVTFYQDKFRNLSNTKREIPQEEQILTTIENCKNLYKNLINNKNLIQNPQIKKNLKYRVVFRSFKPKKEETLRNEIESIPKSDRNLIFIGYNEFYKEFEGIFNLRIQFYTKYLQ